MPRPKRQRPAWLPSCIPFKDGRFLGLSRQMILAWISAILASIFFAMTVSYAFERSGLSHFAFVHSSRSNTILVLRVLSEAAAVFLATTVHSTFEVAQWIMVSRPEGVCLPQFLALQPGTGSLGLLVLALGRGLPICQWSMKPRMLSLFRLLVECALPVLGVLIMSNVSPAIVFDPIEETLQPFAFGMQPFNASVASQLGVMGDMLFNINYSSFLFSPLHAVDLARSSTKRTNECVKGLSLIEGHTCRRHVLITQEYQNVEANLPLTQHLSSDVVITSNQQVYSLAYEDNVEVISKGLRCEGFQSGPGSYRLCVRNELDGSLRAAMIPCPATLVIKNACLKDKSWHSHKGFTTSLKLAFLKATISYDRQDGRILAHELQTQEVPTTVESNDVLDALTILLNTTVPEVDPNYPSPILGSPTHFFGRLIAGHMYRVSKYMETNPNIRLKGVNAVQSILAIALFFCQNGVLGQTVLPFAPKLNATKGVFRQGAFEKQEQTAFVSLATTRFRIHVGRATLIAYIVISGVTLFLCICVILFGSIIELSKLDAEPTLWPALDFWTQCRVEDGNGKVITPHDRVEMAWIYDGKELFRKIAGLKVTRRKRKMRGDEQLELPGVSNNSLPTNNEGICDNRENPSS